MGMRFKLLAAATSAFLLSFATVGAKADTVQFTVVDNTNTVTFDLPENPTPSLVTSNLFQLNNISVVVNGSTVNGDNIDFFPANGNVETIDDSIGFFHDTLGNILDTGRYFTGTLSDPTFVPGAYGIPGDSLTITDISVATTPLPPTWTMILIGLAGFGFVAYRRKSMAALMTP
jgi:hypothetical protein